MATMTSSNLGGRIGLIFLFIAIIGGATIAMVWSSGVDMAELEIRNDVAYKKGTKRVYTGSVTAYYPQRRGKKKVYMEGHYQMGRRDGTWTVYKWNGEKEVSKYKVGRRNGATVYLSRSGQTMREETYKNGQLDGPTSQWDHKGQLIQTVQYKKGALTALPPSTDDRFSKDLGWWKDVAGEFKSLGTK